MHQERAFTRRHEKIPNDAGPLRARGGIGETGAEREAPDHPEHADDGADERGSHGNRAASAAGLHGQP